MGTARSEVQFRVLEQVCKRIRSYVTYIVWMKDDLLIFVTEYWIWFQTIGPPFYALNSHDCYVHFGSFPVWKRLFGRSEICHCCDVMVRWIEEEEDILRKVPSKVLKSLDWNNSDHKDTLFLSLLRYRTKGQPSHPDQCLSWDYISNGSVPSQKLIPEDLLVQTNLLLDKAHHQQHSVIDSPLE